MSAPQTIDHRYERNHSYWVRVKGGDTVRTLRPVVACKVHGDWESVEHRTIPAGTILVVTAESNAGFRGIEFHANLGDGFFVNVSTGAVEKTTR
jgi:hypothetical protein